MRAENDASTQMEDEEIQEIISDRIKYSKDEYADLVDSFKISDET